MVHGAHKDCYDYAKTQTAKVEFGNKWYKDGTKT